MEDSKEMDLDSLLELLDDNEPFEPETLNSSTNEQDPIMPKPDHSDGPPQKRAKVLRDAIREDFLVPTKVENPKPDEPREPTINLQKSELFGDLSDADSSDEEKNALTKSGRQIKREISQSQKSTSLPAKLPMTATWKSSSKQIGSKTGANSTNSTGTKTGDNSFSVDSFSGIRIINPLVSFPVLKQRMEGKRMIKMSFIHNNMKGGDIEGDWVTMGVVVAKVPPKTSKNGKIFSIWKMTDLHDPEKIVTVLLFGSAHTDHWKTVVGTVIGILNASILPENSSYSGLSISVDHPGKILLLGKSKDLGFCKSKRRDGTSCNVAVNVYQCEYCKYHVKKEYKRFSSKRSELQSYTGREPLKHKMLKGQNIIYGGKSFSAPAKKAENKTKDRLTLSALGLKKKAEDLVRTAKGGETVKKLSDIYGPNILNVAEKNSEFINEQLIIPTAGSRNLLKHMIKDDFKKESEPAKPLTPQEFHKLRDNHLAARGAALKRKSDAVILENLKPQLGRGIAPGQEISLDVAPRSSAICSPHDFAKLRAIQRIKENGPLKKKNPNSTKVSEDCADKVKAVLDKSFESKEDSPNPNGDKIVESKLGKLDMNSERIQEILQRKSSHSYEVEMEEMEKEALYFNTLEKKEQMQEKMASIKEIVCDVISCRKCRYTAHTAADRCKEEQHPLKCHKALKRFFACKDCKKRTFSFARAPTKACRNCGGSNFERTSMMKPRTGPKLDSEILSIRGNEIGHLNSLQPQKLYLNLLD